ncbi:MAG: ribosome small subunit-dependent GTPase A [Methylocystaceae bacterium]|nr:ribosome small subunit-dependent GTPase A [Methylocystaceae bacterium]
MKRDYSQFLPFTAKNGMPEKASSFLEILGWNSFYEQQLSLDAREHYALVRITEVHRSHLRIKGEGVDQLIAFQPDLCVGDWVLYDESRQKIQYALERKSLLKRRRAGTGRDLQLIASNIDTAFIVTSCNHDFNPARLERYLALALEAEITPVILLTKTDLCEDMQTYLDQARRISPLAFVVALNAHEDDVRRLLSDWCKLGQTVAFIGSSGVGKSTLVNGLRGDSTVPTQSIREDDSKGRHTTTARQLYVIDGACVVIDTPGMRELQLSNAADGIAHLFDDLERLADKCRFKDCTHQTEPGCAITQAISSGEIEEERFMRWKKLAREEAFNSASLAERRAKDKAFGKMVKTAMRTKAKTRR